MSRPDAAGQPGEVVIARVANPLQNQQATGKPRPAVLVERDRGHWWCMGLTRLDRYRDGTPRTPVPNPAVVGLDGPGWLWGTLTRVHVFDIDGHLGWADGDLVDVIDRQVRLSPSTSAQLRAAAGGAQAA